MGEVFYLDQPTAATMNNVRSLIKVYKDRRSEKYSMAIDKYGDMYKSLMKEVIGQ